MSSAVEEKSCEAVSPYAIVLDSETTGLDATKHRILEIAFKVLHLSQGETVCSYNSQSGGAVT